MGYQLTSGGMVRNVNGIKFTCDGCRIIAATNNKRLTVVDVERGEQIQSYENSAFTGREYGRGIPMATDPGSSHMAVCCCVSGKGLTLFDLRMPLPLDFVLDLHSSSIRDIAFLHPSWPFVRSSHNELISLSQDGVVKVTTVDGRNLHCFEVNHAANCIAVTPEPFSASCDSSFASLIMIGGETMSRYKPEAASSSSVVDVQQQGPGAVAAAASVKKCSDADACRLASSSSHRQASSHHHGYNNSSGNSNSMQQQPSSSHHAAAASAPANIWKMKYTSCGSMLYTVTDTGVVKRYRRYPDGQHQFLGDVFSHKGDIFDMDISPLDEFLVTASKDKTVGLLCLGAPSHGFTGFTQLT